MSLDNGVGTTLSGDRWPVSPDLRLLCLSREFFSPLPRNGLRLKIRRALKSTMSGRFHHCDVQLRPVMPCRDHSLRGVLFRHSSRPQLRRAALCDLVKLPSVVLCDCLMINIA